MNGALLLLASYSRLHCCGRLVGRGRCPCPARPCIPSAAARAARRAAARRAVARPVRAALAAADLHRAAVPVAVCARSRGA
jgi:hypothetical protein